MFTIIGQDVLFEGVVIARLSLPGRMLSPSHLDRAKLALNRAFDWQAGLYDETNCPERKRCGFITGQLD